MAKVAVIMGSKSDWNVMKESVNVLNEFGVECYFEVVSAHRTPEHMYEFAKSNNFDLVIAGAGGSAHLPGMVAALTIKPVIGVPIKSSNLNGIDSLLSIVQMPGGIPVATVAINQGKNAGLLAVSILAINDEILQEKLCKYRHNMKSDVMESELL